MNKTIAIVLLCIVLFAVAAWADNSARIKELQQRQQAIILENGQIQDEINALNQKANRNREEFIMIQGAISELQRQDEAAKKDAADKK
jgi:cbb3-type cytochrome oxidase subunit 3